MIIADTLILGNILTYNLDRLYVEAMAVKNGKILYLGSEKQARKLCDGNTKVLDYSKATIYPGFMDAHCHGLLAGTRLAFECDLNPGQSMEDYCNILSEYIKKYPDRRCYKGAGWVQYEEPLASMLDKVCPDKPVILNSADAHSMWLNTKAMEECGYDSDYAKKMGHEIVHVDENGNPSGLVCEAGTAAARALYPYTVEELKEAILAWQDFAFSRGYTETGEALLDVFEGGAEAYHQLDMEGKLKLNTFAYPSCKEEFAAKNYEAMPAKIKEMQEKYNGEHFTVAGHKIILDGVVEARTAYYDKDYEDEPGYHGVLNIKDQEVLDKIVLLMNEAGIPVHTHAIGDGAVRMTLDAYEKAELATGNYDIRNIICHLQSVHTEDFDRFADNNVVAVVAPLWSPNEDGYFEKELKYLGKERAWNAYPIKSFSKAGVTICFHSDYPVSPNIDPALSIYTAVKRKMPDAGPYSVKNPDEGISVLQAIVASTYSCAYMWRVYDQVGKFAIGMRADCTVFDKDFFTEEDLSEVAETKLVATIVNGEEVFRAQQT